MVAISAELKKTEKALAKSEVRTEVPALDPVTTPLQPDVEPPQAVAHQAVTQAVAQQRSGESARAMVRDNGESPPPVARQFSFFSPRCFGERKCFGKKRGKGKNKNAIYEQRAKPIIIISYFLSKELFCFFIKPLN